MVRKSTQYQAKIWDYNMGKLADILPMDNRWVKLSKTIPWDELVAIYNTTLSQSSKGRPAKDGRLVVGAIIVKHKLNLPDDGTVMMIQENPFIQYFCGYTEYCTEQPFAPSLFVEIRKRLGKAEFDKMNSIIISKALASRSKKSEIDQSKDKPGSQSPNNDTKDSNKGKMIVDATVAEQKISYPTDLNLLNECREISEAILDILWLKTEHNQKKKPRTYRKEARKAFLGKAKCKKLGVSKIRKANKVQLQYLRRNIGHIDTWLDNYDSQTPLSFFDKHQLKKLWVIRTVYDQQLEMLTQRKNTCADRIVSISQPHVRPIVRGKAHKKTEFGAKINVSMIEGFSYVDTIGWDAYNEGNDLMNQVANFKTCHGHYPEVVIADNIYGTRANRRDLKALGIRFSGKPLGRPKKDTPENAVQLKAERKRRQQEYRERIPIEGKFGQGKNGYRLNKIAAKLKKTSESWIGSIFLVMNIIKALSFCAFFKKAPQIIKYIELTRLGLNIWLIPMPCMQMNN